MTFQMSTNESETLPSQPALQSWKSDPVLSRPAPEGVVLHAEPGLRVTMLATPRPGIDGYASKRFGVTHQIASPEAEKLAMAVDLRADVTMATFNQLLIEIYDGRRVRDHIPTAVVVLESGPMIVDVHADFGAAFMACCINEHAAGALRWNVDTLEPGQIGTATFMDMARQVSAARHDNYSEDDLAHAFQAIAATSGTGKRGPSLASLSKLVDADPARGRAKILAMVARGDLTIRNRPSPPAPRRAIPKPPRPAAQRRPLRSAAPARAVLG